MKAMDYRELYCPAHFGNSYEVMGDAEARDVLAEAKRWGFNVYGDWFDAADLKDPAHNPKGEYLLPQALIERKVSTFAIAAELGLELDLLTTPNHVWLDQLRGDLLAETSRDKRFFGQLLCPSKPEAREIILRNHEYLFGLLRERGLAVASVSACPFDYGGCSCDRCRPWIVTFGKLLLDIRERARAFFPDVAMRLIGWWWTAEEHDLFREWADRAAPGSVPAGLRRGKPGAFVSCARHIKYGRTAPEGAVDLPAGCQEHAFIHIGYADAPEPSDVYGSWGPVIAPNRIPKTVEDLAGRACILARGTDNGQETARAGMHALRTGFVAYSEGVFDDVNKALLAGLASGKFASARAVLEAYAQRYFGAKGRARGDWAAWLTQWGAPFEADWARAAKEFALLSRKAPTTWRLAQWESRVRLFEAHGEVMRRKGWGRPRLAAARKYLAEQERLFRQVWGLGPVRHVMHPRFHRPPWFAEYQAAAGAAGTAGGRRDREA